MTTRKGFLAVSSLLALAPQAARAATPRPATHGAAPKPQDLTFTFDRERFDAILARPAKHKQCFGATKVDGGSVMEGMNNTIAAYREYMDEAPASVQTVAVLYHGAAIALAFDDAVWNEILFPSLKAAPQDIRAQFSDARPGKGNPYAKDLADMVGRGSSFFVCHNALAGFAGIAADALKAPVAKLHREMLAGVLAGALVVPAGVMAINACQEAHFTYIQSSV